MQLVDKIEVKHLEAYGDSKLMINQVQGEYEVRHEDLVSYHNETINMAEKFKIFYINHVLNKRMHMQIHWHPLLLHFLFQSE